MLEARLLNEADALATVLAGAGGLWRGLVRGGLSRRHAATWQAGNLLAARWVARLADQLGHLTGELVHPGAALVMEDAPRLAVLQAACAVAAAALPEREAHPATFAGLVRLIAGLPGDASPCASLVRWELTLLTELGYGLDLAACAVTGTREELAYVSPRTGRAVSRAAAGPWAPRLLALPAFLRGGEGGEAEGLRLTGFFLARDAFGARHREVPWARRMLE